jgi:hypothetical protein
MALRWRCVGVAMALRWRCGMLDIDIPILRFRIAPAGVIIRT